MANGFVKFIAGRYCTAENVILAALARIRQASVQSLCHVRLWLRNSPVALFLRRSRHETPFASAV